MITSTNVLFCSEDIKIYKVVNIYKVGNAYVVDVTHGNRIYRLVSKDEKKKCKRKDRIKVGESYVLDIESWCDYFYNYRDENGNKSIFQTENKCLEYYTTSISIGPTLEDRIYLDPKRGISEFYVCHNLNGLCLCK